MYDNILGSHAGELDNLIVSDLVKVNFTFTQFIGEEILYGLILNKLEEAEKKVKLQSCELDDLELLVSSVPFNFSGKDEYESRLKSLKNLFYITNEIEKVVADASISMEDLEYKMKHLDALLKISNHGPLRNLLKNKMNSVKSSIVSQLKVKINAENLVNFINTAQATETIDEIFCEVFIQDYVNLGGIGRKIVAKQFFDLPKLFNSNEDVMDELNNLISNFIQDNQYSTLSTGNRRKQLSNEAELYKQTLTLNHIKYGGQGSNAFHLSSALIADLK